MTTSQSLSQNGTQTGDILDREYVEHEIAANEEKNNLTNDPDYLKIKDYFLSHDFYNRFVDLIHDPDRFYSEPGVPENKNLRLVQNTFRREQIDEDYIVSILYGNGASYREKNKLQLYSKP